MSKNISIEKEKKVIIFLIPILKKFKIGQIERDDGPQSHLGKKGTPTMGGIIIALGIIIGTIGGYIYYSTTDPEVGRKLLKKVHKKSKNFSFYVYFYLKKIIIRTR